MAAAWALSCVCVRACGGRAGEREDDDDDEEEEEEG